MKKIVCVLMVLLVMFPVINLSTNTSESSVVYAAKKKKSSFNKIPKTGNKELDSTVKDVSKQYDELTKRVKKIVKDPNAYTQDEQLALIQDQSILLSTYNDVLEQLESLEEEGAVSTSKYMRVLTYLQKKNSKLLVQFSKLPDDLEVAE